MAHGQQIRLPRQWPQHIKAGILHAISLAGVVLSYARGRAVGRRRLQARLEQAENEIAMLREELAIKDGRWARSRSRRRPHPPEPETEAARRRRRVVAKYPGHTFHVDLTTVPTRAGFWGSWFSFSLPQRWPFCWWVAVAVDQVSRALMGFVVFSQIPSSDQIQRFLDRAIHSAGSAPRYVITDKGKQFWCRGFKRWCKRRGIRPRYGAVREPASIAIVERFIRSIKQEALRRVLVPLSAQAMRREIRLYATWYNTCRPQWRTPGRHLARSTRIGAGGDDGRAATEVASPPPRQSCERRQASACGELHRGPAASSRYRVA